jgi:hypothetical protein
MNPSLPDWCPGVMIDHGGGGDTMCTGASQLKKRWSEFLQQSQSHDKWWLVDASLLAARTYPRLIELCLVAALSQSCKNLWLWQRKWMMHGYVSQH